MVLQSVVDSKPASPETSRQCFDPQGVDPAVKYFLLKRMDFPIRRIWDSLEMRYYLRKERTLRQSYA